MTALEIFLSAMFIFGFKRVHAFLLIINGFKRLKYNTQQKLRILEKTELLCFEIRIWSIISQESIRDTKSCSRSRRDIMNFYQYSKLFDFQESLASNLGHCTWTTCREFTKSKLQIKKKKTQKKFIFWKPMTVSVLKRSRSVYARWKIVYLSRKKSNLWDINKK